MATTEQVEGIRDNAQKIIEKINHLTTRIGFRSHPNVPVNSNMRTVLGDLKRLDLLLTPLFTYPIASLADRDAYSIISSLIPLYPIIDEIEKFETKIENTDTKNNLVVQLRNQTESIVETVAPWVTYLAYAQGDVQKNIKQIAESVETARVLVEQGKETVDKKIEEADRILDAMREASAEAGVATFTRDFADKAATLKKTARWWLIATAVSVGVTISCAIAFLLLPMGESLTQLLQVATTKFIILGLLFTATVWCGRMYKATIHQAAVNEFRANGLKTFQAFIEATDDDATRDAVLLETTHAIFTHAPTGLIDAKAGDSEGGVRIFEMIRDAARKATPAADDAG